MICFTGSHGKLDRVSWELGEAHGNFKGSHGSLVICLTGSRGNLKGFMGT